MSSPLFTIGKDERDPQGSLLADDRQRVTEVLLSHGLVLLPSDTAYSVAAIPFSKETRESINTLLKRQDMPVSLAFSTMPSARPWIASNPIVTRLLEEFCPGPVTVVCKAAPHGIPAEFFGKTIASRNRTIGVRIPDSVVERDIAAATPYPVTTVAVRDLATDDVIASFENALDIIESRIGLIDCPEWCAIEGDIRYGQHSTVVEVTGDGTRLRLIREGDIPFTRIRDEVVRFAAATNDGGAVGAE